MEQLGHIRADCQACAEFYKAENPLNVFAPRHRPSDRCESGMRAHCTCDTCF
jgi:hypothetical protein